MKCILVILIVLNSHLFSASIEESLCEKYKSDEGILSKVYIELEKLTPCKFNEKLIFYIKIDLDTSINNDQLEVLKDAIDYAFNYKKENTKIDCDLPTSPIYDPEKSLPYFTDDKCFYVQQTIKVTKRDLKIYIEAKNVTFIEYDKTSTSDVIAKIGKQIENTSIDIKGSFNNQKPKKENQSFSNEKIIVPLDNLINRFWEEHEKLRLNNKSYLKSNYLEINKKIYKENIKDVISKIANTRNEEKFKNFLVNFLGNENVTFYEYVPQNQKKYPFYKLRDQEIEMEKFENYSLYKTSSSEKKHNKINFLPFGHYITISDSTFKEILIVYESQRYVSHLQLPLNIIFKENELGEKFYHDISRFFYGFTTALSIQDFDWISEFYHDLAIRSFFPGVSDLKICERKVRVSKDSIVARYNQLFIKGYEIYVTLNESGINENHNVSTTWIYLNNKRLPLEVAAESELKNLIMEMPAFYLETVMDQKWKSIRREDQVVRLEDKAKVYFLLLCLNIDNLLNWIRLKDYDFLTIFSLGGYFSDLYQDMIPNEKTIFEKKYPNVFKFVIYHLNELKKIQYWENPNLVSFKEEMQLIINDYNEKMLSSKSGNIFDNVTDELESFFLSDLRKNVHNRRFLFNICYIKILYQYTYDKNEKIIATPKGELFIYKSDQ